MYSTTQNDNQEAFAFSHAETAGFFLDSADYYSAFYQVAKTAIDRLLIVGWDFDVRVALHRELGADGKVKICNQVGEFLEKLVENNKNLEIYILIWDSPYLLGTEKDNLKNLAFSWTRHERMHLIFESAPISVASLHEKFVVVDRAVAFLGGMDITGKRWDTAEHRPDDPRRREHFNRSYVPYHDIQVMVTGEVVDDLARLGQLRWQDAAGSEMREIRTGLNRPELLPETFFHWENVAVQIQLTRPSVAVDRNGVQQIENFYRKALNQAENLIFLEHQYIADEGITELLSARLQEPHGPQIILIVQQQIPELVGKVTMGVKSAQMQYRLLSKDKFNRLSILTPYTEAGPDLPIKVHSKLMAIDNDSLSVGSANLNQRSFKLDYETNLVFTAEKETDKEAIDDFLLNLLSRHARIPVTEIRKKITAFQGNWQKVLQKISENNCHLGWRTKENIQFYNHLPYVKDAAELSQLEKLINTLIELSPRTIFRRALYLLLFLLMLVLAMTGLWYLINFYDGEQGRKLIEALTAWLEQFSPYTWQSFLFGVKLFLLGTLLMVPTTILIIGLITLWGEFFGAVVSLIGMLSTACLYYFLGRLVGLPFLSAFQNVQSALQKVKSYGCWGVAITRIVPTGPFILVNVATGSIGFKWIEMLVGSLIGILPGVVFISIFSGLFRQALRERSIGSAVMMVIIGLLYIGALHYIVKMSKRAIARIKQTGKD